MNLYKDINGYEYYIDNNHNIFMTSRQIGIILDYSSLERSVNKIAERNKSILEKFRKKERIKTNGGEQNCFVYNRDGIIEICKLSSSSVDNKIILLNILNVSDEQLSFIINRNNHLYKENELKAILNKVFQNICLITNQVICGKYRIDFILDSNIIVECNENNHEGYDKKYEQERKLFLLNKGYTILEYNPDKDDVFNLINNIFILLNEKKYKNNYYIIN